MRIWAGPGRSQLHGAQGPAKAGGFGRGQSANLEALAIVQLCEGMMGSTQAALYCGLNYLL